MTVKRRVVAVFGSSEPGESDALYATARAVGRALADAGFDVVTGGYGGVMEAASRGARDGGAGAHGVLCATFGERGRNGWLTTWETAPDLFNRTRLLVEHAEAFVVLDGKAGTLAELSFLWALQRAGCLDARPVVIWGDAWGEVADTLSRLGHLDRNECEATLRADEPLEAVEMIARLLR